MDETSVLDEPETAVEAPVGEDAVGEAGPQEKERRAPGRRYVYRRWCKGCGICIAFCPQHVFAPGEDGRAEVVNPEACTNCEICDRLCPDFAITLAPWEDKYERLFQPTSLGQDKAEGIRSTVHR